MSSTQKTTPNWRPAGYASVTPALTVQSGSEAIAFYAKAFGATEVYRMTSPDGRVVHAEIQIGDSKLMLGEEAPHCGALSPRTLKGTPVALYVYVPDADATFNQAVAAGATAEQPVSDMFWGDRCGILRDPFGHRWWVGTHKEDLSQEEISERAKKSHAPQGA